MVAPMIFELDDKGFFAGDVPHDNPEGLTNWTRIRPPDGLWNPYMEGDRLSTGEWVGKWHDKGESSVKVPPETFKLRERFWRDNELRLADLQINRIEDGGGDAKEWRAYRQALRDYPASADFAKGVRPRLPLIRA